MHECKCCKLVIFITQEHGTLQLYPTYKNLVPRFLGVRKEGRVLRYKMIFAFPGCFGLGVMRPLNFQKLDALMTSLAFGFIENTNRIPLVG